MMRWTLLLWLCIVLLALTYDGVMETGTVAQKVFCVLVGLAIAVVTISFFPSWPFLPSWLAIK